jgi:Bifunctional DNA primase/polymerase, N-terminal
MSRSKDALRLAGRRYWVLPCWPDSKVPVWRYGVYDATRNADVLNRHFRDRPRDNVAIATEPSGVLVVDLDVPDGPDNFATLCDRHGVDGPVTLTRSTPRGGLHLEFTSATTFASSTGRLGPGIDVKAAAGYVLVPSSTVNGNPYRLTVDVERLEVPGWLAELCGRRRQPKPTVPVPVPSAYGVDRAARRALERDPLRVTRAPEGARNNELNRVAYWLGGFVGAGRLDRADVVTALTAAALAAGLEPYEIGPTIRSGLDAGSASPLTRPSRTRHSPVTADGGGSQVCS